MPPHTLHVVQAFGARAELQNVPSVWPNALVVSQGAKRKEREMLDDLEIRLPT